MHATRLPNSTFCDERGRLAEACAILARVRRDSDNEHLNFQIDNIIDRLQWMNAASERAMDVYHAKERERRGLNDV